MTEEIGRPGASLRGVASDGKQLVAALASGGKTSLIAVGGWHAELPGDGGPVARAGDLLVAAASTPMRGEPGSVVAAFDSGSGGERWRATFDATGWALIPALAPAPDGGVIVGGSFAGTLRVGTAVVSSAGKTDGFVAKLNHDGGLAWLIRMGGAGDDAVQGVAAARDRVAIAGTFTVTAELGGVPLPPIEERTPVADAFVAELAVATGARRWAATYGGKELDAVAGVAIDRAGRVVVAGTARGVVHVGSAELTARGPADGLVIWLSPEGEVGHAILLGGNDFDGISAIAAAGTRVVVGGFFSGTLAVGARALTAGGGDDAWLAALDDQGAVTTAWQAGGEGREEITALASVPGGFVAGVAHTARASIDGAQLAAPSDPASGAAIVVRGVP